MHRAAAGYAVLGVLVVFSLVHAIVYYPMLPARVVSHFNAQGQVDGWTGKDAFVVTYACTVLGTAGLMAAIGLLAPRLPKSMINLPHKDYWLSPERERATFAAMSSYFAWLACATVVLLIVIFHASFAASLGRQPPWWLFPVVLGGYLLFTLLWCVILLLRFRKPKE